MGWDERTAGEGAFRCRQSPSQGLASNRAELPGRPATRYGTALALHSSNINHKKKKATKNSGRLSPPLTRGLSLFQPSNGDLPVERVGASSWLGGIGKGNEKEKGGKGGWCLSSRYFTSGIETQHRRQYLFVCRLDPSGRPPVR